MKTCPWCGLRSDKTDVRLQHNVTGLVVWAHPECWEPVADLQPLHNGWRER